MYRGNGGRAGAGRVRRRLVAAGLPLGIAAGPAALGGCEPAGGSGTPARSPVTVSFLTNWAAGARLDLLNKVVPEFQKQNPHVTVSFEPKDEGMRAMLVTRIAGGAAPDVALGAGQFFYEFVDKGFLLDISPTLRQLKVNLADYTLIPGIDEAGGKRYGLPFQFTITSWFYNKSMFDRAGLKAPAETWTWNDLVDAGRALSKPDAGQWGILMTNGIESSWGPFVLSNGDDHWISPDFKKTLFDRPAAIEAAQFAVDLIHRHRVAPNADEQRDAGGGDLFRNQKVAIRPVNSGYVGTLRAGAVPFDYDVFHLPQSPRTRRRRTTMSNQPHWVLNGAQPRLEAATQLVAFLAGDYTQGLISDGRGSTPVYKKLQADARYQSPPPASMRTVTDTIAYATDMRFHRRFQDWFDTLTKAMDPAFNGQQSVADGMREATRLGDQLLAAPPT